METKLKAVLGRKKKRTKVLIPGRESYLVACIGDIERVLHGCSSVFTGAVKQTSVAGDRTIKEIKLAEIERGIIKDER